MMVVFADYSLRVGKAKTIAFDDGHRSVGCAVHLTFSLIKKLRWSSSNSVVSRSPPMINKSWPSSCHSFLSMSRNCNLVFSCAYLLNSGCGVTSPLTKKMFLGLYQVGNAKHYYKDFPFLVVYYKPRTHLKIILTLLNSEYKINHWHSMIISAA